MGGSGDPYAMGGKPDTEKQVMHGPTHAECKKPDHQRLSEWVRVGSLIHGYLVTVK